MLVRAVASIVLALHTTLAFAGLPGQDKDVDALRVMMQRARIFNLADLSQIVGVVWKCKSVEAIEGASPLDGPSVPPQFILKGNQVIDVQPIGMYTNKVYSVTPYGLMHQVPDGKFMWKMVYRLTSDGKLVGELSLSPQGGYKQGGSVVLPGYFAKVYDICTR